MILLDTNVVSEPLRPAPAQRVVDWMDLQALETLYLSAITVAELRAGVALLPSGKRRKALHEALERRILPAFAGRVLAFDLASTSTYAAVLAQARKQGVAIATADALIAAIAIANGFSVATRDGDPFRAAGVAVIDPWSVDRQR